MAACLSQTVCFDKVDQTCCFTSGSTSRVISGQVLSFVTHESLTDTEMTATMISE